MPKEIPIYDPNAVCSKCGHDIIKTTYDDGSLSLFSRMKGLPETAHMERYCQRCGHLWAEKPLDNGDES